MVREVQLTALMPDGVTSDDLSLALTRLHPDIRLVALHDSDASVPPDRGLDSLITDLLAERALTSDEIQQELGVPGSTLRTALGRLLERGKIRGAPFGTLEVYVNAGVPSKTLLLARPVAMSPRIMALACALSPRSLYRQMDLDAAPGIKSAYDRLRPLAHWGILSVIDCLVPRLFALTQTGSYHPLYKPGVSKARPSFHADFLCETETETTDRFAALTGVRPSEAHDILLAAGARRLVKHAGGSRWTRGPRFEALRRALEVAPSPSAEAFADRWLSVAAIRERRR